MRAVIYARVSRDEQREGGGESIPDQIVRCREYIEKQGWALVGDDFPAEGNGTPAFVDDYSGYSEIGDRPTGKRLLAFLAMERPDFVVVATQDRFARDTFWAPSQGQIEALKAHVRYTDRMYSETPADDCDDRKPIDSTLNRMQGMTSGEYRETVRYNTKTGRRNLAAKGKFVSGRPPLGYRIVGEAKDHTLEIEPETAEIVQRIFAMAASGVSVREIVRRLDADGTPTPLRLHPKPGHKPTAGEWVRGTVVRILDNPAYYGKAQFLKTWAKPVTADKSIILPAPASRILEIDVPPLVTREQWDAAHARRPKLAEHTGKKAEHFYLLNNMVFCAEHGHKYQVTTRRASTNRRKQDTPEYRLRKSDGACRNHAISGLFLERSVWDMFTQLLDEPHVLADIHAKYVAIAKSKGKNRDVDLKRWTGQLNTNTEALTNLDRNYHLPSNRMSHERYETTAEEYEAKIKQAKAALADLAKTVEAARPPMPLPELRRIMQGLAKETIKGPKALVARKALLQALGCRVEIDVKADGRLDIRISGTIFADQPAVFEGLPRTYDRMGKQATSRAPCSPGRS